MHRGSEIVERAKLILKFLQGSDEPLEAASLAHAFEQAFEKLRRIAQFLGVLADLVPRLVINICNASTALLHLATKSVERVDRKLGRAAERNRKVS